MKRLLFIMAALVFVACGKGNSNDEPVQQVTKKQWRATSSELEKVKSWETASLSHFLKFENGTLTSWKATGNSSPQKYSYKIEGDSVTLSEVFAGKEYRFTMYIQMYHGLNGDYDELLFSANESNTPYDFKLGCYRKSDFDF